jgi:hypothetical protein
VKVILECLSVNFLRDPFDPFKNIRGLSEMDKMGKMIFMGSSREPHIHFHQIKFQLGSDKKIDTEIHS